MCYKAATSREREDEICDRIRETSDELARLGREGKDTTEILLRLEAALAMHWSFRWEAE